MFHCPLFGLRIVLGLPVGTAIIINSATREMEGNVNFMRQLGSGKHFFNGIMVMACKWISVGSSVSCQRRIQTFGFVSGQQVQVDFPIKLDQFGEVMLKAGSRTEECDQQH